MKRVLLAWLSLLLVLALCACKSDQGTTAAQQGEDATSPSENNTQDTTTEPEKTIAVQTPYGDLQVPGSYEGVVEAVVKNEDPYTLTFQVKDDGTELYTLYFGQETADLIGTLLLDQKNVVLYADFAELNENAESYLEYAGYQQGINTIVAHLVDSGKFVMNEVVIIEDTTTFDIKTGVVTLKYPNKWKDKVTVDVTEDVVKFSYKGEKLFDLVFKECEGYLLGTYDNTPIYIISYTYDESGYSEEEKMELRGMENDVNVILQHLMEDSKFVIS